MENLKNKMYDLEVTPPQGVWEDIVSELDKVVIMRVASKRKPLYFTLAAAATVTVLVLCAELFSNTFTGSATSTEIATVMTVPDKDELPAKPAEAAIQP